MKIVIDAAIPFINGVFEPFAEVVYKDGKEISSADVADADALVVRTRTRCDAALLDGSSVKMIASATIGMDHIDLKYCAENKIFVQNAAGCNAGGVMNYVFSALYGVAARKSLPIEGSTIGIIGVGNVGGRVEHAARVLGFKVLRCDPPRAARENPDLFTSLEDTLEQADIITMHVPLLDTTRGMCNEEFFSRMKPGAIFINAARGEIVDEAALKAALPNLGALIIDTWNGEPEVDRALIDAADVATPHIAGYSYTGKLNATMSVVRSVARFFDIKDLFEFYPASTVAELEAVRLDMREKTQGEKASVFQYNYPIFTDDFMFRMQPEDFESLRTGYAYRREFYID